MIACPAITQTGASARHPLTLAVDGVGYEIELDPANARELISLLGLTFNTRTPAGMQSDGCQQVVVYP